MRSTSRNKGLAGHALGVLGATAMAASALASTPCDAALAANSKTRGMPK